MWDRIRNRVLGEPSVVSTPVPDLDDVPTPPVSLSLFALPIRIAAVLLPGLAVYILVTGIDDTSARSTFNRWFLLAWCAVSVVSVGAMWLRPPMTLTLSDLILRSTWRTVTIPLNTITRIEEHHRRRLLGERHTVEVLTVDRREPHVLPFHRHSNIRLHLFLRGVHAYARQIGVQFDVSLEKRRDGMGIPRPYASEDSDDRT